VPGCPSNPESDKYFPNFKRNIARLAQRRSRALAVELPCVAIKTRRVLESDANVRRLPFSDIESIDQVVAESTEQIGQDFYAAAQLSFAIARVFGSDCTLIDPAHDATSIRASFVNPQHARPGVPFHATREFIQTKDINLDPGPEVGSEKQGVFVPFVSMRMELRRAAGRPATSHNSSGGGRD
jgi:hypothetical protein